MYDESWLNQWVLPASASCSHSIKTLQAGSDGTCITARTKKVFSKNLTRKISKELEYITFPGLSRSFLTGRIMYMLNNAVIARGKVCNQLRTGGRKEN